METVAVSVERGCRHGAHGVGGEKWQEWSATGGYPRKWKENFIRQYSETSYVVWLGDSGADKKTGDEAWRSAAEDATILVEAWSSAAEDATILVEAWSSGAEDATILVESNEVR